MGYRAAFLDQVERACAGVAGVAIEPHDGYLAVTIELGDEPAGLSERARSLVGAFPAENGVRRIQVDVRNRQWAAMVIEIVTAISDSDR